MYAARVLFRHSDSHSAVFQTGQPVVSLAATCSEACQQHGHALLLRAVLPLLISDLVLISDPGGVQMRLYPALRLPMRTPSFPVAALSSHVAERRWPMSACCRSPGPHQPSASYTHSVVKRFTTCGARMHARGAGRPAV